MKSVLLAAMVLALATWDVQAQARPDFSGTWVLDAAKSDQGAAGRGPAGPVVIKQTATEITVGAITVKFDGTPAEFQGRGGATQKVTAKWDGNRLVSTITGDFLGQAYTTTQTRSLSADGKVMTVENRGAQGGITKQVFTKAN
jgi:hypothetical protein